MPFVREAITESPFLRLLRGTASEISPISSLTFDRGVYSPSRLDTPAKCQRIDTSHCRQKYTACNLPRTNTTRGGREGRAIAFEHHTTPPSSRSASSDRFVRGTPAGARPLRGWLIPRVPYSGLVPQGDQAAALPTRPREGDVCEDVLVLDPRRRRFAPACAGL